MPEQITAQQIADALEYEDYEVILNEEDKLLANDEDENLPDICISFQESW